MLRHGLLKLSVLIGLPALLASPAFAQNVELTATLSGTNETPTPINTGAFGNATATVDPVAQTIAVTVRVWNLPSGATGGHIHVGGPGTGGPVIWNLNVPNNISNDFTVTAVFSCANLTLRPDQGIRSCDDAFQSVLGENTYVNIHSAVNPGGEIRGQLVLKK